jgi:hypothetical protein
MLDGHGITLEEGFFNSIYGYEDIKKLLIRCIFAKEPTHVLLTGPPGSCKTMFVLEMAKRLDKTYFMDATSASGPGMIDYLFENNIQYLFVVLKCSFYSTKLTFTVLPIQDPGRYILPRSSELRPTTLLNALGLF